MSFALTTEFEVRFVCDGNCALEFERLRRARETLGHAYQSFIIFLYFFLSIELANYGRESTRGHFLGKIFVTTGAGISEVCKVNKPVFALSATFTHVYNTLRSPSVSQNN